MNLAGWLINRHSCKLENCLCLFLEILFYEFDGSRGMGGGGGRTMLCSSGLISLTFTCFSVSLLCLFLLNFPLIPLEQELFGAELLMFLSLPVGPALILKHWLGRRVILLPQAGEVSVWLKEAVEFEGFFKDNSVCSCTLHRFFLSFSSADSTCIHAAPDYCDQSINPLRWIILPLNQRGRAPVWN